MRVYLAGYNVDTEVLRELQKKAGERRDVTPEVLSAAYARISRDSRSIDELRKDAREEIDKARKSNKTIIFKMGHSSIAEHAAFNFDIIGVSRLAMEEVEKFRLCSYTEKSQRYITLENNFVVPEEIKGTRFEKPFIELANYQNETYSYLVEKLNKYVFNKHKDLSENPKNRRLLEGWAKEDARYITSLATESQTGYTANARNLELLLRRFASHYLKEIQSLGEAIYKEVQNIAPSIILHNEANSYDQKTYPELRKLAEEIIGFNQENVPVGGKEVKLVDWAKDGDSIICASLLHTVSNLPYDKCKMLAANMTSGEKKKILRTVWGNMRFYDSVLREFEYADLTFDIVLSAACFGQLKRHRMATTTVQDYNPDLGNTIPESIKDIGEEKKILEIIDRTNELYREIKKYNPFAAPYILTNSHRRRVLLKVNARELYHISRLREDSYAQWDIRNIAGIMSRKAKKVMPLTFALLGGKDKYNDIYRSVFGELPKITESTLPPARKIKT